MRKMIALAAGLAALTLPAAATAQPLPAPATTVQATTGPQKCSVTAFGSQFVHPRRPLALTSSGGRVPPRSRVHPPKRTR
jgi:hypothetical protein